MLSIVKELTVFLVQRRKFWLVPILIIIAVLGGLMMLVEASPIAPFIYPLF